MDLDNGAMNQGGFTSTSTDGFQDTEGYSLRVGRDGRVAVAYRDAGAGEITSPQTHTERLREMWDTGKSVLELLGAIGEVHVALRVHTRLGTIEAAAWSDMDSDGKVELDTMVRDVRRALGQPAFEPEVVNAEQDQ